MSQPPIITIHMVPAGVELVLQALNQLPRAQVDALWQEIAGQYRHQIGQIVSSQADIDLNVEETQ